MNILRFEPVLGKKSFDDLFFKVVAFEMYLMDSCTLPLAIISENKILFATLIAKQTSATSTVYMKLCDFTSE